MLGQPGMRGTAVILNEIDQAGSESLGATPQDYLELTEACVCCVSHPELVAALQRFAGRPEIQRVVIETTGMADPLPLAFALRSEAVAAIAVLDAVITVVDPLNFTRSGAQWQAQIQAADLVVMSKYDLASPEAIDACMKEIKRVHPAVRVIVNQMLEPEMMFDLAHIGAVADAQTHHHLSDFASVPLVFTEQLALSAFEDALEALPEKVFRGKGWVLTDEGWIRFHLVGGRLVLDLDVEAPPHGESRAIFFGRSLMPADLRSLRGR